MKILADLTQYFLARSSWDVPPPVTPPNYGILASIGRPAITKEEAKEVLHFAFGAPVIHLNDWHTWLKPSGYEHIAPASLSNCLPQVEARDFCFFDVETGLKIALFQKGKQLLVLFGALNSSCTEVSQRGAYLRKALFAASYNLVWGKPLLFQRACEVVQMLRENPRLKNLEFVLTGQSLGGGLSAYVALKLDMQAICFNSLPLGNWVKQDVDQASLKLANRHVKHVFVESDWLSDNFLLRRISEFLPGFISTPQLFGEKRYLPTAYPHDVNETHAYIVGSLQEFLGFNMSAPPSQVVGQLKTV